MQICISRVDCVIDGLGNNSLFYLPIHNSALSSIASPVFIHIEIEVPDESSNDETVKAPLTPFSLNPERPTMPTSELFFELYNLRTPEIPGFILIGTGVGMKN